MDPASTDVNALARQLYKPEGVAGEEVGKMLAQRNADQNAFTFSCLQIEPADHVLEIGFGPGEGIAEAVRLTPQGYVAGIDHSDAMLKMAQERNHRAIMEEHVELTLGDAAALPYEDESFDKIFSVNVFHFWPEPLRELAECRRVLKTSGLIVFFLTHPSSWLPGMAGTDVFIAREPEEIEKLFARAGFRNVESRTAMFEDRKGFAVLGTK
ncbi:MAG: methylase [Candidatus Peregrinibacteria bacterium Greene0416_19]|nr:MAG: methylase [Candidatus Peregrinibacteria bacterium Greene0416_19]